MTNLAPYSVTFSADGVPDVTVLLDETPVNIPSGYGGWIVVSRQRRVGLTQWNGKDPLRLVVPILFEGYKKGVGQELAISHLSRMALPPSDGGEPPVITVDGDAIPSPGPDQWVIENLQWGTQKVLWETVVGGVTVRVRQDCVVNLLEYRGDDRAAFKSPKLSIVGGKSKTGWPKKYVTKKGDTLQSVAVHFYKNAAKWKKIADANSIRDPKTVVKGTTLTIPAP